MEANKTEANIAYEELKRRIEELKERNKELEDWLTKSQGDSLMVTFFSALYIYT